MAGDAPLRARIAAGLLGLAGRRDVEVCAGERAAAAAPARALRDAGPRGALPGRRRRPRRSPREPAPERIVRAAREIPGLELVAVGPLTNLARALALDPELPRRVAGLTVMGGHVREVRIGELRLRARRRLQPLLGSRGLGGGAGRRLPHHAGHGRRDALDLAGRRPTCERLAQAGPLARALAAQIRIWEPVQRRIFTRDGRHAGSRQRRLPARSAHGARADRRLAAALRDAPHRDHDRAAACCARTSCRWPPRSARRCASRRRSMPARAARAIVDRLASA